MGFYPGQQLGRRYTIERELGIGGIGITYLAKNQRGELRVIKTLREDRLNSPEWLKHQDKLKQDFRDEAWNLVKCDHPYIVKVERQFDEGNLPCMEMEYIDGEDLEKRVREKGALLEPEALLYIMQIGDALTLVHKRGLLHRDLKPSNIMIRRDKKEAVLIDFGIARQFISGAVQQHTKSFTDGYAPPEQYVPDTERGEYTDIYALAATLYTLLTGQLPMPAPARLQNFNLKHPQNYNPGISDRVNAAIMKGMELDYKLRPQSVPEWLSLLGNNIPVVSSNISNVAPSKSTFKTSTPLPPTVITPPRSYECLYTISHGDYREFDISPDGQILAIDGKLLKLRTGELIRILPVDFGFVSFIAFSPDGRVLASGIWDDTIKLWDVGTGKELRTLTGHCDYVWSVAFSRDGQILASGSKDETIKLWDVGTGKELYSLTDHDDIVLSIAFSPDGQILGSGSRDETIKLWDVRTGKELRTLTGHSNIVFSVAFSPDGNLLASGSEDRTIKLWDMSTVKKLCNPTGHTNFLGTFLNNFQVRVKKLCNLTGHSNGVTSVAFSPDGQILVSSDRDGKTKVWGRV